MFQKEYTSGAPRKGVGVSTPFLNRVLVFKVRCSNCASAVRAVTEFVPHYTEAKPAGWCSGKKHCYQCGIKFFLAPLPF